MKKLKYLFLLAAAGLSMPSCVNGWEPDELLRSDGQVDLSTMVIEVSPVYGLGENHNIDEFVISITSLRKPADVMTWKYSERPEIVTLPEGEYSLLIESGSSQAVAWDIPYYCCEKKISVKKDEITVVESADCELASVMVSVAYSDALKSTLIDDAVVTVSTTSDYILEYVGDEQRVGYIPSQSGNSTMVVTFEGAPNGIPVKSRKALSGISTGCNYEIKLTFKENIKSVDDIINIELIEKTDDNVVGDEGADDDPRLPGFSCLSYSFDEENTITLPVENDVVKVKAFSGVKYLEFVIVSDVFTNEFMESLGATTFYNLGHPGEMESAFRDFGLPVAEQVVNQSEVDIPITIFTELFSLFEGEHSLKFSVTDNNGFTTTEILTFNVMSDSL